MRYAVVTPIRGIIGTYPDREQAQEAASSYSRGFPERVYNVVPSTRALEAELRRKATQVEAALARDQSSDWGMEL